MSRPLKQRNIPQIATFLILNALSLAAVAMGLDRVLLLVPHTVTEKFALVAKAVTIPSIFSLIIGLAGWAIPGPWKEALVFWRTGATALPSSGAFTKLAARDPRIDVHRLRGHLGALPREPAKQTALWYSLYRKHSDNSSVEDAHRAYLRYREMTALIPLLLIGCAGFFLWHGGSLRSLAICGALLASEYLIVLSAARNAAVHLVTNVLAIESSTEV